MHWNLILSKMYLVFAQHLVIWDPVTLGNAPAVNI